MRACRWWAGWLLTALVGYVALPAAFAIGPWLSDEPEPRCNVTIDWCLSDREGVFFLGLFWAYAVPLVLGATFAVLALLRWAMPREVHPPPAGWRTVLGALRLVVLLGPTSFAGVLVATS